MGSWIGAIAAGVVMEQELLFANVPPELPHVLKINKNWIVPGVNGLSQSPAPVQVTNASPIELHRSNMVASGEYPRHSLYYARWICPGLCTTLSELILSICYLIILLL